MFTVGTAGVVLVLVLLVVRHRAARSPQRHVGPRERRVPGALAAVAVGLVVVLVAGGTSASAAPAPVGLGTAASFAVLGGEAVSNTGPSVVTGDLGVSPGTAVTGFPPGVVLGGVIHSADAVALQAQADVTTAYNDAAGRPADVTVTADLGGQTLVSGVYFGDTLDLTGTLTLDAEQDPDAVWVFQAESTLITASSSVVNLIGGANPCNVFWQVGSSATLGTGSVFVGTILALTAITVTTATTVEGRLFARTDAVTLDSNVVTAPDCEAGPEPTTTSPPTTGPATTAPATTAPPTTVPPTTMPATTLPATTLPATTQPATTLPATTLPATTLPATTLPATTQPATTQPATTMPATTMPATTMPATTLPATTQPATTQPATTMPATTQPATTQPVTTQPATTVLPTSTTVGGTVLSTTSTTNDILSTFPSTTTTTTTNDSSTTTNDSSTTTNESSTTANFGPTTTSEIDLTSQSGGNGPGLPVTGANLGLSVISALVALTVGGTLVLATRRRAAAR